MNGQEKGGLTLERQLKALADPARRRIVELLRRKGCCSCDEVPKNDPGLCICDLQTVLGLTQPTITHHVRVLRHAGLIETRRIGRWLYCKRSQQGLNALVERLRRL